MMQVEDKKNPELEDLIANGEQKDLLIFFERYPSALSFQFANGDNLLHKAIRLKWLETAYYILTRGNGLFLLNQRNNSFDSPMTLLFKQVDVPESMIVLIKYIIDHSPDNKEKSALLRHFNGLVSPKIILPGKRERFLKLYNSLNHDQYKIKMESRIQDFLHPSSFINRLLNSLELFTQTPSNLPSNDERCPLILKKSN